MKQAGLRKIEAVAAYCQSTAAGNVAGRDYGSVIELEDLKVYLDYWIDKMGNPSKGWKKPEFHDAFAAFVTKPQNP